MSLAVAESAETNRAASSPGYHPSRDEPGRELMAQIVAALSNDACAQCDGVENASRPSTGLDA